MPKKKIKNEDKPAVLTKLKVKGFKCFRDETEIDIKPLTVLAGANSSGKTSIIMPLLMIKQTIISQYNTPFPLLIKGDNVKFTSLSQVFWKDQFDSYNDNFVIEVQNSDRFGLKYHFNINPQSFTADYLEVQIGKERYKAKIHGQTANLSIPPNFSDSKYFELHRLLASPLIRSQVESALSTDNHATKFLKNGGIIGFNFIQPIEYNFSQIVRLFHLPGVRGNKERSYPKANINEQFKGFFQSYFASFISSWEDSQNKNDFDRLCRLDVYLRKLGIGINVETKDLDSESIEIFISRTLRDSKKQDLVSIADVGFGVSQVLPVLVALLAAEPGQIVYIEQPEIHLHPKAQVLLAEIIAEASKRGVIVIIETHSDMLLLGIRRVVAKGKLDPSLVSLNWFKRDKKTGAAKVTKGVMNEKGAVGNWPEDFSAVSMKYESEYLDMVL